MPTATPSIRTFEAISQLPRYVASCDFLRRLLAISSDSYLRFPLIDTSLASNMLGWHEDNVVFDEHINGKLAESWAYHEIAAQADITGDYSITHYRDSDKREIDFVVERDDGHCAGIEVKCGSSVGDEDFKHLKWFRAKFNMDRFTGIVLYTGNDVLSFGNHMYAVPFANLT